MNITNCYIKCKWSFKRKYPIEYIVVHYPGNTAPAVNQCKYYSRTSQIKSAHFVVDSSGEIYQCLPVIDGAYHVVSKKGATNNNSIGIDMCCEKLDLLSKKSTDDDWYHTESCMIAAAGLIRFLMREYGIPIYHVLRHYDVTGKICPASMCGQKINRYYGVSGDEAWIRFKQMICGGRCGSQN